MKGSPHPESGVEIGRDGATVWSLDRSRRVDASKVRLRFGLVNGESNSVGRAYRRSDIGRTAENICSPRVFRLLTQAGQTEENDSGPRSVELLRPFLVTSAIRQRHATGSACAPGDRLDNCSGGGTSIRLKLRSGMSLRAKPSNPGRVLCKPIKLTTSVPIAP